MLHIRQGYHAYTSSHRIFYPSSVAAKRISINPGSRNQGVKRLNVGLVHAAQRLTWIDHESPDRETHPQDCLSSHGHTPGAKLENDRLVEISGLQCSDFLCGVGDV